MKAEWNMVPALHDLAAARETFWANPEWKPFAQVRDSLPMTAADIDDAAARLERFASFLMRVFPETRATNGLIESPLREIEGTRAILAAKEPVPAGRLYLKMDSDLAVAGSVKARGGIYEVLKHTEDLALEHGILRPGDDYAVLADHRDFFSQYTVQVGSTGNLGLSIGIMSAAVGYHTVVHMSADARQWKKDLLRQKGVEVREYVGDYGMAVAQGRALSDADPKSYFVDDEHSSVLFLGYAVAGRRLAAQLDQQHVTVDAEHPLVVTVPCGVGGAPGGVAFGLKHIFGDNVYVFISEPTQCPCMLAGLASGEGEKVCVQDFGLTGITEADGLAVSRPSGLVSGMMRHILSGGVTVADGRLFDDLRSLNEGDGLFIEPSSCAAFQGFRALAQFPAAKEFLEKSGLGAKLSNAVHILWATGGSLVPEKIRADYLDKRL